MKKLLAFALSIAMLATLFVGVTFAATPTATLQVTQTGTAALNADIILQGALLPVGGVGATLPTAMYSVIVQRRPIGGAWGAFATIATAVQTPANRSFHAAIRLTGHGDYRVIVADSAGAALNATGGIATPILVHTIGTVARSALAVTPTVPSVVWRLDNALDIPMTVTRVVGGTTTHVPLSDLQIVAATFNGLPVAAIGPVSTVTGNIRQFTVTNPTPAVTSGTISFTVRHTDDNWEGVAHITVAPRAAFNASVMWIPDPPVAHQPLTILLTSAFDAAGLGIGAGVGGVSPTFAYTRTTFAGPIAATTALVDHGSRTVTPNAPGVITVTVEFYSAAHALVGTVTREITVPLHRITVPVTAHRRGDVVALSAIITDALGNRINNAEVTFTAVPAAGQPAMFRRRLATAGTFEDAAAAGNSIVMRGGTPLGHGQSVVNGEYSVEVTLNSIGQIDISVRDLVWDAEATAFVYAPGPERLQAIAVTATAGYTVTLAHTLLAGGAAEAVPVTVTGLAAGVTPSFFIGTTPVTAVPTATPNVWNVSLSAAAAGTFTITAANNAVLADATIIGTTTITAVAPVVAVTPAGGRLTAEFRDVITVTVTDPRTNVPVARAITVAPRNITAPNGAALPTTTIASIEQRAVATPTPAWGAYVAATSASAQQYQILAHTAALSVGGVAQAPQVRITVAGAPPTDLTLHAATLVVGPASLVRDSSGTVTVRLNNAHGVALTGRAVSVTVPANVAGGTTTFSPVIPTGGILEVVVVPSFPTTGVMPASEIGISVTPDRAVATALTATIPVVAPPAPPRDTARPTIEVTAPSVTTDANAMITIVARDNVAVTGIIFEGAPVAMFPGATVTIMRTVALREGLNSFTLSVTDAAGNVTDRIIVIDRRIPAPVAHTITIGRANPAIGLDVPANVRNGRLMVPFRWFGERILNATVDFRVVGAAEIVTLHRGNMHVELTLNSTIAKVNGVPVALDVAPFATGGRTLVPARFLAETFGYIVNWNPVNDEVTFTVRP
ncbi:MAG: copper amine oxidase N-terminal domain-containing protein [Selenomonadales bacterium]|nr:copper amine oxidase N-terminal domain-containing protein [Selenomonadales bacterium]